MKNFVLLALLCGFSMPGLAAGVQIESKNMLTQQEYKYLMVPISGTTENYVWSSKDKKGTRFLGEEMITRGWGTKKREPIIQKMLGKFKEHKEKSKLNKQELKGFYFQQTPEKFNGLRLVMLDKSRALTKDSLLALVKRTIHAIVITRKDPNATIAIVLPSLQDKQSITRLSNEQLVHLQEGLNEYIKIKKITAFISIVIDESYGNKTVRQQILNYDSDCDSHECYLPDENVGNSNKSKGKQQPGKNFGSSTKKQKPRKGSWGNGKQDSSSFGKQDKSWKGEEKDDIEVEETGTEIEVYLKSMVGKIIVMEVKDGITLASLKEKYHKRPGSTDFIYFVRKGKRLGDVNLTLKDSGVTDGCTLHMINE